MFLKQYIQPNGRVKLAVYESYREGKRTRQRTVKSLGFVDELIKEHKDPILWGKKIAKEMTEAKKKAEQAVQISIYPMKKIDKRTDNIKNIGCAAIFSQYSALNIREAICSITRYDKCEYDINAIARLLVCERIINPNSKLSAWQRRNHYFFRTKFSDDDMYRSLDRLSQCKDSIIASINRSITKANIRDMSCVYYDVTNYYFEIDQEDELRKKGVSKEKRPNPIVQMGLLQDANAIPIAYKKFPGNSADCTTMLPVLKSTKSEYNLNRIVVVADKALNCSDNIAAATLSGDGFVFSQSVRGTKSSAKLKSWVIKEDGYTYSSNKDKTFKSKSMQGFKTVHLKAEQTANGKAQDVTVDVKYVAFWSKKYERRARHERARAIEKARKLIKSPSSYTKATSYGAAQYVKNLSFNKDTGEIVDGNMLEIDIEAIKEAEKYDGYYLIVTSETKWSDAKIIDTYRQLWKIEESFKITKSELKTRPVYVWKPKHIEAHFLICYIALTILRLLQYQTGLSCSQIRKEIKEMNCVNVDSNWWTCTHRTDLSDIIVESLDLEELKLKNLKTKDATNILAKARKWKLPHNN